jgi:predicted MFS family arabinose efflux permease
MIIFLAPLLGSVLADLTNIRSVFFVAGGLHILAVLLFWKYKVADEKTGLSLVSDKAVSSG